MLNYIWGFMILVGVLFGAFTGNIEAVGNGVIESSKEAVSLAITMLGVTALWSGIMEIATASGLIKVLSGKLIPALRYIFPEIPAKHKVWEYISMNFIANMMGLGWAATPSGLKTMSELKELNIEDCRRRYGNDNGRHVASNAMCTFLVINLSSLQLIPINMIAYRSQYGSVNPSGIIAPTMIATCISTLVAIVYCKIKNVKNYN